MVQKDLTYSVGCAQIAGSPAPGEMPDSAPQLGPVLALCGKTLSSGSLLSHFETFLQQEKQYSFKM